MATQKPKHKKRKIDRTSESESSAIKERKKTFNFSSSFNLFMLMLDENKTHLISCANQIETKHFDKKNAHMPNMMEDERKREREKKTN